MTNEERKNLREIKRTMKKNGGGCNQTDYRYCVGLIGRKPSDAKIKKILIGMGFSEHYAESKKRIG